MMKNLANISTKRLLVELETGGNVRYEQGQPSNIWYSTCHDLVLSRFCAWDYKVNINMFISSDTLILTFSAFLFMLLWKNISITFFDTLLMFIGTTPWQL